MAETDLGMFSMFGRTGAPQKGVPQEDRQNLMTKKEKKVNKVFQGKINRGDMMTKRSSVFLGTVSGATPGEGPTHFFLNRGGAA